MKNATANDINVLVTQVIDKEARRWPQPQVGQVPDMRPSKISSNIITEAPMERQNDARLKLMGRKCNSPRHLADLKDVMHGRSTEDLSRSHTLRGCGQTVGDMVRLQTISAELEKQLLQPIKETKIPSSSKFMMPRTASQEVGWFAQNPMHKKWKRSDGPSQRWRKPKNECNIVEFGRIFYETTGVNCFSRAASSSLFNGKPQ